MSTTCGIVVFAIAMSDKKLRNSQRNNVGSEMELLLWLMWEGMGLCTRTCSVKLLCFSSRSARQVNRCS